MDYRQTVLYRLVEEEEEEEERKKREFSTRTGTEEPMRIKTQ